MKTLDGLMLHLAKRLTAKQYRALVERAVVQKISVRDYVGRRVLRMVQEQRTERSAA